jgi:plastocyanin
MPGKELSMTRRTATAALAALAATAAAVTPAIAIGDGGAHASSSHIVVLKEVRFHPSTVTINHGETVTWEWRDAGTKHNVTFHGFHSRTMGSGAYSVKFLSKGTFNYRCTIHEAEGMRGKVIVR